MASDRIVQQWNPPTMNWFINELVPDNVLYRVDITLQSKQRLVNKLTECNLRSSPAKSSHLLSIISDISIQVLSFNRSL